MTDLFKNRKIISFLVIILVFNLLSALQAAASESIRLYVSTINGNDTNAGTENNPFKTIERAKEQVRILNKNMSSDIVVNLRGGTYYLNSTFSLSAQDSGTNGFHVIYQSYPGETAVISGGKKIEGWTLHDQSMNIWKASAGTTDSRQLYVNGIRATRAKTETGAVPQMAKTATGHQLLTSYSIGSWNNIQNVEFVYQIQWKLQRMGVSSVTGDEITMKSGFAKISGIQPTWIENAYELLDNEGEWYLDKSTGMLYYKPRAGESMATANVILPSLEQLVTGVGTSGSNIHNIKFTGLDFEAATWLGPNLDYGFPEIQANFWTSEENCIIGNISFIFADHIVFEKNRFLKMGAVALWFERGGFDNLVEGNEFYDISSSAIMLGHPKDHHPADSNEILKNNRIRNNYIHNTGAEYWGAAGIFQGYTENTLIAHNELCNMPYTGISNGWGWGDWRIDIPTNPTPAKNNRIYNNLIHDIMKKLMDGGGVYSLGAQPGLEIKNNVVYTANTYFASAYYLDDGSKYATVQNNVSYDTPTALYTKGSDHVVTGNYFDQSYLNTSLIGNQSVGHGTNNTISNTVITDGNFPDSIIDNAGIQIEYLDMNLAGHWKLDESANAAYVANSTDVMWNDGIVGSEVTSGVQGKIGSGAMFNKTHISKNVDNNINLGTISKEFVGASEITVTAWIKPKGYFYYQSVFSIVSAEGNLIASLAFENSTLKLFATNNRYSTCAVSGMFPENTWNHIALTIKMSSSGWDVQIYVNGVKCAETKAWGIYFSAVKPGYSLLLGSESYSSARSTHDFNGTIDDVRLYFSKISSKNIKELYNSAFLIGHWSLNDNQAVISEQTSGIWEQAVFGNSVETGVMGKLGKSFRFIKNGGISNPDNYLYLGGLPTEVCGKNGDDKFTISAWIKPEGFNNFQTIFSIVTANTVTDIFQLRFENNKLQTLMEGGLISEGFVLNSDEWYSVAVTIDYCNTSSLCDVLTYVNGNLYSSKENAQLQNKYLVQNAVLYIGTKNNIESDTQDFNGKIDEIALYNKIYTADELTKMAEISLNAENVAADSLIKMRNSYALSADNAFSLNLTNSKLTAVGGSFKKDNTINGIFENEYFGVEKIPQGFYISKITVSENTAVFTLSGTSSDVIYQNCDIYAMIKANATFDCKRNADEAVIKIKCVYKTSLRDISVESGRIVGGLVNWNTDEGSDVKVVAGVYNTSNQLQEIKYITIIAPAVNDTNWFAIPIAKPTDSVIKVFVWKSIDMIDPLAYPFVLDS